MIEGLPERSVEEGDTLTLVASVVTVSGDTVPDPAIVWTIVDPDTGQLGFTLDSLSGLVTGVEPGGGRVRPRFEDMTTLAIITVTVTPAPDSVASVGDHRIALAASDSVSAPMVVAVFDLTTDSSAVLAIENKPVQFYVVNPLPGSADASGFYLAPSEDGQLGEDQHRLLTTTNQQGQARAVVKRISGSALPDSAVVEAAAATAAGDWVAGSPVRFVVLFGNG
ncbi:MAG: hypothetical protein JSW71_00490 [Gemmatimonadota bacterium]|nr:MAG: hypothetical protein JSW71_00490 [Gemmatimonadota bacterium]